MGKVYINPLPTQLCCEAYSFFDQTVVDFENYIDSIITDSENTPEVDASYDEADAMPSLVFQGFYTQ